MTELMRMLVEAGYSKNEMAHSGSDLYVFVTPISSKVIKEWCYIHDYRRDWHCPVFQDQITGCLMYDCFACYAE